MTARRLRPVGGATTALALVGVLALGACGVGFDDEPRALQAEASTTTVADEPQGGRTSGVLYYVLEGALVPFEEELPDRSPSSLLSALMTPPQVGSDDGQGTSIPSGTELLGTSRDGDRLTVDLSSEFDDVVGLSRQQAIGQMVLTVTQQGSVEQVEFSVDGETITVSSPLRGDTTEVTACDFAPLLASADDVADADLPPTSLADLDRRREQLDAECAGLAGD
jgi:hypothetical protein